MGQRMTPRTRAIQTTALVLLATSGCGGAMAGDSLAVPAPRLPPSDGLLENAELQAVVDLQTNRDGSGLQEVLENPDPFVRARAALALASVQDPTALPALEARLSDSAPEVRANAAFAIGQLALEDGGLALLGSLMQEEDPEVRRRLIEAVGKRGGLDALSRLLEVGGPDEEGERTLAVARAALREVRPPGVLEFLVSRLTHPDPEVRSRSAYYFGRVASVSAWTEFAPRVRAALDGYAPDETAAMDLVAALGRLADVPQDAARMATWLGTATDWRTRTNVARAVLSPRWLESEEIQTALLTAIEDPSEHVRIAAATSITLLMWSSEEYLDRARGWIQGPPEGWRVQALFAPPLVAQGGGDLVLDWTRRMADYHPVAAARGIESLGGVDGAEVMGLLFDLGEHPDFLVRAAAVNSLSQRWARGATAEVPVQRFYELFARRLADSENLPAARAAAALAHPDFVSLGAESALEEAFLARRSEGDPNILVPLLESMGPSSLELLRDVVEGDDLALRGAAARGLDRLTGEQVPIGGAGIAIPTRTIDWPALAELGPEPRIRISTDQGEMVLRLYPEQAPLSVQTLVDQIRRGEHDGTRFHRVVSNFVIQGGDFGLGDGGGSTGYRIRSEFTRLPFQRGVLGMASAGKDTEGSQYYLTHSAQPHLEGGYTAFGWIEEGWSVLDRIQQGDQVLRMTLED